MPLPESEKIPTTLVVGFLGAGKSSLINHILASRPTKADGSTTRCAVVENELGEVGIDSHLGAFFLLIGSVMDREARAPLWPSAGAACDRNSEGESEQERREDAWIREREGEEEGSPSLSDYLERPKTACAGLQNPYRSRVPLFVSEDAVHRRGTRGEKAQREAAKCGL